MLNNDWKINGKETFPVMELEMPEMFHSCVRQVLHVSYHHEKYVILKTDA